MTELTYTLDASHIAAYQKLASERASNRGHSTASSFDSAGQLIAAGVAVAVPLAALDLLLPFATGRSFATIEFLLGLIIGVGLVAGAYGSAIGRCGVSSCAPAARHCPSIP